MTRSATTTTTIHNNNNNNIQPKLHSTSTSSSASTAAATAAAGIATATGVGGGSSWSHHHHRGSTQPQVPLSQVLTVPPSETLLVTDAVAALCDGRFVLYAVAAAALSSSTPTGSRNNSNNTTRVFWISCTCVTEECIRQALKKLGCNDDNDDDRLYIDSLPTRLIQQAVESTTTTTTTTTTDNNNNGEDDCFQEITFVKELYQRVQAFVTASSSLSPTMVILDDVSALSVLVGERLTHALIVSLNDLSSKSSSVVTANDDDGNHHNNNISSLQHPFSLVLRCSNDCDIHHVRRRVASTGRTMEPYDDDGDDEHYDDRHAANTMKNVPWERALVELADTVVDVTSVPSGYSREIAGRLILTRRRRRSSTATTATTTTATTAEVYNVCLTDHQVFVLRLAAT